MVAMHPVLWIDPSTARLLALALLAGAAVCWLLSLRARAQGSKVERRISAFVRPVVDGARDAAARAPEPAPPRLPQRRRVVPAVAWLARVMGNVLPDRQIARMQRNLAHAGLGSRVYLAYFLAAKALFAAGLGTFAALYIKEHGAAIGVVTVYAALGGVLGFYLPGIWLGRKIAARRTALSKALPDALDLLAISVGAGLGFEGAVQEVVGRWRNPLTEEFQAVLRDLRLGRDRREGLRGLAERTGLPEIGQFTAAVIQADKLGTPLKDALSIQADQIRLGRRQRAEETARKATVKMILPMAMFIFPAMFIVLLGPAIPMMRMLAIRQ